MKLRSAAFSDDVSGERLDKPMGLEQPANTTRAKPAVARRKQRIVVPPKFIIAHTCSSTAYDAFDPGALISLRLLIVRPGNLSRKQRLLFSTPPLARGAQTQVFLPP